jgi:hypothetical protein
MHSHLKFSLVFIFTAFIGAVVGGQALAADKTLKDKTVEAGHDMSRGAKKLGRAAADKTCPMVNGKAECAVKEAKHGVQNAADKMEDAAD